VPDRATDAAGCAAALASRPGERRERYEPVAGETLCLLTPPLDDVGLPALVVRMVVRSEDAGSGAVTLSATGWASA
jgi:hypothetical protein